jgi:hypothetical protein
MSKKRSLFDIYEDFAFEDPPNKKIKSLEAIFSNLKLEEIQIIEDVKQNYIIDDDILERCMNHIQKIDHFFLRIN